MGEVDELGGFDLGAAFLQPGAQQARVEFRVLVEGFFKKVQDAVQEVGFFGRVALFLRIDDPVGCAGGEDFGAALGNVGEEVASALAVAAARTGVHTLVVEGFEVGIERGRQADFGLRELQVGEADFGLEGGDAVKVDGEPGQSAGLQ